MPNWLEFPIENKIVFFLIINSFCGRNISLLVVFLNDGPLLSGEAQQRIQKVHEKRDRHLDVKIGINVWLFHNMHFSCTWEDSLVCIPEFQCSLHLFSSSNEWAYL